MQLSWLISTNLGTIPENIQIKFHFLFLQYFKIYCTKIQDFLVTYICFGPNHLEKMGKYVNLFSYGLVPLHTKSPIFIVS